MADQKHTQSIVWQDIHIEVTFEAQSFSESWCHLQVKADQPLPITETGYRSHFMHVEELTGYDDHISYLIAWLDHASTSKEWKRHVEQSRQGNLFDC